MMPKLFTVSGDSTAGVTCTKRYGRYVGGGKVVVVVVAVVVVVVVVAVVVVVVVMVEVDAAEVAVLAVNKVMVLPLLMDAMVVTGKVDSVGKVVPLKSVLSLSIEVVDMVSTTVLVEAAEMVVDPVEGEPVDSVSGCVVPVVVVVVAPHTVRTRFMQNPLCTTQRSKGQATPEYELHGLFLSKQPSTVAKHQAGQADAS